MDYRGKYYYPFGMLQPGRSYAASNFNKYRFGFNSKEIENYITTDAYDFGARIYDGRIGRWLSTDAYKEKYANLNPYNGMGNNPVLFIDPDGNTIIINARNQSDLLSTTNYLALLYMTQKGKEQISRLHTSNISYFIKSKRGVKTEYSSSSNTLEFNPHRTITEKNGFMEGSLFTLGHEIDHMDRDERGKASLERGYEEGMAVNAENYYRSVAGLKKFKTSYDFGWWDNKFSDNPDRFDFMFDNNPNPKGEIIKVTGIKVLSKVKIDSKDFYTVDMNTYDANSKEVKEAKTGTIFFFDYQKDKNSKVEKKAIIQTINFVNAEKK